MIETIALGVFVFTVLTVAGWRYLDAIERVRAERLAKRLRIADRERLAYRGPLFNRWGREL